MVKVLGKSMFYVRTRNLMREYKKKKISDSTRQSNQKRLSAIPSEAESAFKDHIKSLVAIAKSGGASVILSSFATLYDPNLIWDSPIDTIKKLSAFQRKNIGALNYFTSNLTIPAIFEGFKRYNKILHDVAIQEKTGWVDNGNIVPHEDQYFVDRVHFSILGAELMGRNFAPHVKKILKEEAN